MGSIFPGDLDIKQFERKPVLPLLIVVSAYTLPCFCRLFLPSFGIINTASIAFQVESCRSSARLGMLEMLLLWIEQLLVSQPVAMQIPGPHYINQSKTFLCLRKGFSV